MVNARSIKKKLDEFSSQLTTSGVDVGVIMESWLHSYNDSAYISIRATSYTGEIVLTERVVVSALLSPQESYVSGELIWNILFSNAYGYGFGLTGYHVHSQALYAGLFTFLKR